MLTLAVRIRSHPFLTRKSVSLFLRSSDSSRVARYYTAFVFHGYHK